jgi:hypothetical protein
MVIPRATQFNRQQDQTNASLISLGGGTRRGNNYTPTPITDSAIAPAPIRRSKRWRTPRCGAHLRREMGRTGGGVFNTTLKSGANELHGTGFVQTRPLWGQTNNYFSEKAGLPKPNSPYYLGGGGVGGAIVRNRTFFWFASENYHDVQTRNASVTMPTSLERQGNRRRQRAGQPVSSRSTTGSPSRKHHPSSRLNDVALAMTSLPADARTGGSTAAPTTRGPRSSTTVWGFYSAKGRPQVHDSVTPSGLSLQPHRRAGMRTISAPPRRPSRRGSPIRTTTSRCAARRSSQQSG